eukprot:2621057-Prymnesium_polylepis.1
MYSRVALTTLSFGESTSLRIQRKQLRVTVMSGREASVRCSRAAAADSQEPTISLFIIWPRSSLEHRREPTLTSDIEQP